MATRIGAMKTRNAAAREYAQTHADVAADFAALYYWVDQFLTKKEHQLDSVVPLFRYVESHREQAANDAGGKSARLLSERLSERSYRSTYRGMMSEFGDKPPDDPCDPEDSTTICNLLGQLPVPGVKGLAILTRLVDSIPGAVLGNGRPDRVLPTRIAMVAGHAAEADARRAGGRLFTPAMHSGDREGRDQVLLGFGGASDDFEGPALPLTLYDLGADSKAAPGRAAPLALRLWIEGILSVDLEHREAGYPLVRSLRLRDLLARLYPNHRPRPAEYWPRLMNAAEALASHRARIPWEDPATGRGGLRSVVTVSDIPRGPGALDDLVSLTVHLPPGSGAGPVISPRLPVYGVESAAQYRALIGLSYLWFNPGVTRTPVGKGRRRIWVQSKDPRVYPRRDDDAIIPLCFPTSTRGQRRNLRSEARKALDALIEAGEVWLVQGHLMPPRPPATDDIPGRPPATDDIPGSEYHRR